MRQKICCLETKIGDFLADILSALKVGSLECNAVDNFNDVDYLSYVLHVGVFTESDDSYSLEASTSLPSNIEFLTWLSSGACEVDSSIFTEISGSLLSSASSMNLISLSSRDAAWRKSLIQRLRARDQTETSHFAERYEEAISQVCKEASTTSFPGSSEILGTRLKLQVFEGFS